MVFSAMSKSFSNTIKTRPPLVVFTICLMGITVTTFSLAYYIHNYQQPLLNVDAKDEWVSLLKHFNTYDVCIENAKGQTIKKTDDEKYIDFISTTTMARVSNVPFKQITNVEGIISLDGWSSKCLNDADVPKHIFVALTLNATNSNESVDVCVTLKGPANFMPKLEHSSCGLSPQQNVKKWGKLTSKLSTMEQSGFCTGGSIGKLEYDINFSKNLKWNLHLSPEDRARINYHLIVVSLFLLVICVVITCYAVIKSRSATNSNTGDTKQSLMSKGMYL